MTRLAGLVVTLVLASGAAGCFVTDARQTLLRLDEATLVAEGRRDICLRLLEDDTGAVLAEDCDIEENPLGLPEPTVFSTADGVVLVGTVPVDVAEVVVDADGRALDAELVDTDLVSALYLAELPADLGTVTIVARTATGDTVDDPRQVALP